ncbi:MAG TPA: PAS domain S-box protein [Williamwhitmania sp.]|nr:PAS domain S-box protein [Williamwhitmania sp.]
MKHHDKTKDELMNELLEVQQKYNSLKELYDTEIIELNQAEQVLKNSEERLSLVFNNTSDMLVLMEVEPDKKLRITAVNRSYLESIKQLISKDDLSINDIVGKYRDEALIALGFSKENLDAELQYFLRVIASGTPLQFEQTVPLGTSNIYLESNIVPVTNTAGRCTHLLYSVRDISERKSAEMKLKESEGKYRTLFENIPIGIGITDLTGKLVTFNDSILEPGSYSRDDLIRIGSVENLYYNLSDRGALIPLLKEKGTITHRPIKFKCKDGSPYDTLLTLTIIHINDQPMIQAVIEDITERKRVEESLRFFRVMLDKSNDAIEVIDVETARFIDVNERACADLGYSRDELLSMKIFDIDSGLTPDVFHSIKDGFQLSNSTIIEALHRRKDGSIFPVEVNIAVVKLEKMYLIAVVRDITERKNTEAALRESEARFRLLFEISADGISIVDTETKTFIYTNPAVCRMLGYTEAELKSMSITDIHPKQDLPWIIRELESMDKGEKSHVLEIPCQRKNGSIIDTEITSTIAKIGGRICKIGIHRDITEKKLAENKLRKSEEQLKEAQLVGLFGSWELDVANNRIAMSDEMYKIFDLISRSVDVTMETLLGTPIPEDRKMVRELVMKSLETREGVDFDFRTMTSNGEIRWIHERSTVEVDSKGNPKRVFGTCQDITERKLFELKLQESEERFRSVAKSANDAIVTTDSHGIILDWNKGAEKIFGYTEAEVTGKDLNIILPQSYIAAHNHGMKRIEQGGEHHVLGRTMVLKGVHKNGKEFPLELSLAEWETSKGKFFTGIIRDITERKRIEEALLRINTAVESTGEAICMSDPQGYHFYHNKAYSEIFEYTVEEIQAAGGGTAVYENKDVGRKVFDTIMGGGTWNGEVEMVSKSGRKFTVLLHADSIKDENGIIVGLVGIHTDMTERKLAELKLKESEERLSEINKTDFVWEVDEKGVYTYTSQTGIDLFGSSTDEIVGKTPFDFMTPDDRARIASIFSEIVANRAPIKDLENWNVKKNGELCCLLTNGLPILDKDGNLKGYRGVDKDITERKRAEDALRESEENFRSMFENNSAAMIIAEPDTTVSIINDEFCKLSGYSKQEVIGTSWTVHIPPEDRERLEEYNRRRMINANDVPNKYEFSIYNKKGEIRHALMSVALLRNNKTLASFIDITERKHAEEVLIESERRTRALLDANPDMIFRVNREGTFLDYKADSSELYAQTETSIIGKKNRDITPPEFADLIDLYIKQTIDSGKLQQFEYQMLTPKRGLRNYEARMVASGIDEVIAVVRDVTERKKAEEKIKESEEKYRLLAESSPEMIYFIDTKGYVTYVNKVAAEQFHAPAQKLIGKHLTDIFPPDLAQQNLANIQNVIATKSTFQNEVEIVFPTGSRWVDARLAPVIDEKNNVIGVLGLSYDITERKRAEEEIRLKNEQLIKLNAEKDKFFSIMAHDLKSPFSSIMGFSEVLLKQVMEKNYQSVERYSGIIYESSQRAVDLLTNLMEWSRSQTGRMEFNPEYFEMVKLINEVILLFAGAASQKSITITEVLPANAPVYADKNMMSTVLRNLISNAIKFTYKGGAIVVSTENKQGAQVIAVRDNGVGIPKDRIEKLFRIDENFSTLGTEKEKGTGLGMILCKEFVEKHGGQIWVESEEGKGSIIYFTIPSE